MATINGTSGDDFLSGGSGNDEIHGLEGNDVLNGGGGNDIVDGGDGDDLVRGNNGDDQLSGGSGNDNLRGGAGVDSFDGGSNTEGHNLTSTYGDRISFYEPTATAGVIADLRTGVIWNDGFGNVESMVDVRSPWAATPPSSTPFTAMMAATPSWPTGGTISTALAATTVSTRPRLRQWSTAAAAWTCSRSAPTAAGCPPTSMAMASRRLPPRRRCGWSVNLATGQTVDGYGQIGSIAGVENVSGSALNDVLTGDSGDNVLDGGGG